jgi:hypothetical protein
LCGTHDNDESKTLDPAIFKRLVDESGNAYRDAKTKIGATEDASVK